MGTALLMPREVEANPIAYALLEAPVAAVIAKIAVIVIGIATVSIARRKRPGLARWVYPVGIVAGCIGLWSNLAVIRALAEGA